MSFRRNPFQGIISINGKRYLARDIIEALLQQGVVVNFDESGLIIGYKRIPPVSDENLQRLIERGDVNPAELMPVLGACNCQEKIDQLQQMMQQMITLVNQLLATFPRANLTAQPSRPPNQDPFSPSQSASFKDQLSQVMPSSQGSLPRSTPNSRGFMPSSSPNHSFSTLPAPNDKKRSDNPWSLMDQLFPNMPEAIPPHPKAIPSEHPQQKLLDPRMSVKTPFQASRCHSCKSPLPSGSLFCSKCGAKVRT